MSQTAVCSDVPSGAHDFEREMLLEIALNEMAQGLVMFDAESRLLVCNERYIAMYALPRGRIRVGMAFHELIQLRRETGTFKGEFEIHAERVRDALRGGAQEEHLSETPDGRAIHVVNRPLANGGWVSTHQDVTAQRRTEKDLHHHRELLDLIVENVPITIWMKRVSDGTYVHLNRFGEEWLDVARADVIGRTIQDLFPGAEADFIAARDAQALTGPEAVSSYESEIELPKLGRRITITKRLQVRSKDGREDYLLGLTEDVTDDRRKDDRIRQLVNYDALTDLPNRVLFHSELAKTLGRVTRGERLAVHYLDLDHFKTVNDTLGHPIGDELLKEVAVRLRGCVRATDTIARLSGDEFAIIQAPIDRPSDAQALATRIFEAFTAPFVLKGHQVMANLSLGIAVAPDDGLSADVVLKNADLALYKAKAEGRGGYRFFESDMHVRMVHRQSLEHDLRHAIQRDELAVFYQPVIDLATNAIAGFEALLRWRHPGRGLVSPASFIQLAEETGLIVPLGHWVLERACRDAAAWPSDIKLAVNISPQQFRGQNLPGEIERALRNAGLPPERLEIEVTESLLARDRNDTLAVLQHLTDTGVQIAVDDFGAGQSSLGNLLVFPIGKIKIDRGFVRDMTRLPGAAKVVEAIVELGGRFGLTTTAEGIETAEQRQALKAMGCHQAQGYLFGIPRPIEDVSALLAPTFPVHVQSPTPSLHAPA